MIVWVPE